MTGKLTRKNVLVLEQEKAFALLLKHFLWAAGFNPVLAVTASEAKERFDTQLLQFSVLISQTNLGETNAAEFAGLLQQKFPKLKVLYISPRPLQAIIVEDQMTIPEENFLQKPFGAEKLIEKLGELLGTEN